MALVTGVGRKLCFLRGGRITGMTTLWYVGAGFLLGWVISTLTAWLWFRGQRVGAESSAQPTGGSTYPRQQPATYPAPAY